MVDHKNYGKILVVDIETTGFLERGGSICEVGLVELNLVNGDVEILYDQIVKEDILDESHQSGKFGWIFQNSDLTFEEVMNATSLEDEREVIQMIIDSYPLGITAFNKKFDLDFLKDRGFEIKHEQPCIMLSATPACELPNPNGYSDFKWPKVEEAWEHFFPDEEYVELHRGADDALHEAKIAYKLYREKYLKISTEHLKCTQ